MSLSLSFWHKICTGHTNLVLKPLLAVDGDEDVVGVVRSALAIV